MSISSARGGRGGFTLIELLIAIAIAALVAGLIGGLGVERVEKARAQAEYLALERLAQGLAFRAYAGGRPIRIHADGAAVSWQSGAEPAQQFALRFWFVQPAQDVLIDGHGIASPGFMSVAHLQVERRIAMNAWLEHGR